MWRAETGRSSAAVSSITSEIEATPRAAPAPDLDALARQVYDILKRRLSAELRRRG